MDDGARHEAGRCDPHERAGQVKQRVAFWLPNGSGAQLQRTALTANAGLRLLDARMLPRRDWTELFFGSRKPLFDSASFCCADKRHAEDVFDALFENACGSLTSLMHEAGPLVKGNGRFIRSKDLEFKAREACCESRVDRLSEKLAPEAAPAEISEQPHSEYARVPKAFALVRRDVTPADDFISFYGYELDRRALAEKRTHFLQRWRLEERQPPSLPRNRIQTAVEALRISRGASSYGHV